MMKHPVKCILVLLWVMTIAACGAGKQSAVEGKLVDGNGKTRGQGENHGCPGTAYQGL